MLDATTAAYLPAWSEFLARQLGLHFPRERWGELERKTGDIATAFGFRDAETCACSLPGMPLTRGHIDILASHLTVGETYFFREKRSFDALEQHVLPRLLARNAETGRRLRLWSAGCCTGEEPYSIAIVLDRLIPDLQRWNITILATDINPQFLSKAAAGIFGDWSFRDTPEWIRERYLQRAGRRRWEVRPWLKERVTFSYLNLAADTYPMPETNTEAMDLILCRNVLMYFTPTCAKAVVEKFHRALVVEGWLVVSPAEASRALLAPLETVQFPGAILGRKSDPANDRSRDHQWSEFSWPPAAPHAEQGAVPSEVCLGQFDAPATEPASEAVVLAAPPVSDGTASVPSEHPATVLHRRARSCADLGQLAEGAEWCRRAIGLERVNPAHYYLLATIQQEMGEIELAIRTLGGALYLDPDFILGHFLMGRLRLAQGRRREAARCLDVARALLERLPQETVLPESDGLMAGRLEEIIAHVRSGMRNTTRGAAGRGGGA